MLKFTFIKELLYHQKNFKLTMLVKNVLVLKKYKILSSTLPTKPDTR